MSFKFVPHGAARNHDAAQDSEHAAFLVGVAGSSGLGSQPPTPHRIGTIASAGGAHASSGAFWARSSAHASSGGAEPCGYAVSLEERARRLEDGHQPECSTGGVAARSSKGAAGAADDDDEETWLERLANSDRVTRVSAAADRLFQNYAVAILMDWCGVLLFLFDIYTDALVVHALSQTPHHDWMMATLFFILGHYGLMAVLIAAYLQRTTVGSGPLNALSGGEGGCGECAALWSRRARVLALLPVCLPGVVALDIAMLFTSVLPMVAPRLSSMSGFSSFLSNYNFSRFFIEFVFESIPQTVLQTYIYHQLTVSHLAGSAQQRTVALSLAVSSINCIKYSWKLYKAADDAGLTLFEYFKYLLLLKGNYECSPGAMISVINECCSAHKGVGRQGSALAGGSPDSTTPPDGALARGLSSVSDANLGSAASGSVFVMNGFHLHRHKSQYGPAQQAYILLNAFDRMDGREEVTRWVVRGCPLASINRILEKGIKAFKNLNCLEVSDCALRGDTWKLVTRAIKRHKRLDKVKLIQTGLLLKYRNAKLDKVVAGLFKHSLRLRTAALAVHWWAEEHLQTAVELYLRDHPTLESLAIELPPAAAFAARDPQVRALPGSGHPHTKASAKPPAAHESHLPSGANGEPLGPLTWPAPNHIGAAAQGHRGRHVELAGGRSPCASAGGAAGFGAFKGGAASVSPFALDVSAAATAAAGGSRRTSHGGGLVAGAGAAAAAALAGLAYQGSHALSSLASFVSDGTVSAFAGLAAATTGAHPAWGLEANTSTPGAASLRYCALVAAVVATAPALRCLYIHNHALPSGPGGEGLAPLAAALVGNERLELLSLRGSTVGDGGAAALARALSGPAGNSRLRTLSLRGCRLQDDGVAAMCACLADNRGLTSLDLSHNRVAAGRVAPLARALRLNSGLRELRLEGWRDTWDGEQAMPQLAAALASNSGLRTLSLAGSDVASGASVLAAALAVNTALTCLDLCAVCSHDGRSGTGSAADRGSGGGIDDTGIAALASALARNRSLKELYLAGCRCGEQGGAALYQALRLNGMLQVLDLSGSSGLSESAGGLLGSKLSGHAVAAVTERRNSGSSLGDDDAGVAEVEVEVAEEAGDGLDDAAATFVFTALQASPSPGLRVLRMRGARHLTLRAVRAAAEMLRRNTALTELDLSGSTFALCTGSPGLEARGSRPSHGHLPSLSSNPQPLRPKASSASLSSMSGSVATTPPATPARGRVGGSARAPASSENGASEDEQDDTPRHAAHHTRHRRTVSSGATLPRNGSSCTLLARAESVGGLGAAALGSDPRVGGLSADALELLGALWSALAGGLATNARLRVVRLAHCGVGAVGAAALAPALMENRTLEELDLSGLPAATARLHLAAVIARGAAAGARGGGGTAASGQGQGPGGEGASGLIRLLVTDDTSYEAVDLLGAGRVTSRAAEEAAAAVEEARRVPRGHGAGAKSGALLGGWGAEGRKGSERSGEARVGWGWVPWRR